MEPIKTLGQIVDDEQQRDAIHIAIAPVIAARALQPGAHVGLNAMGEADDLADKAIGVIDPFLKEPVLKGQRCWLMLYPNSITGLRHEWAHPSFVDGERAESEKWLRDFARKAHTPYEELLASATRGYFSFGTTHAAVDERPAQDELWRHLEIVMGRRFSSHHRDSTGFSCSC